MESFPTRPFQESKPQNGDPDKFSIIQASKKNKTFSTEHKNFNSDLWVAECQHLQLRNQREKKLTKICYGYTGSLRGDSHGHLTKNYKEKEITIFQVNND